MTKLTFIPPRIGEDYCLHFTRDQARSLGIEDNFIWYAVIVDSANRRREDPPVLVMSPLHPNGWGSLFTASFTLERGIGQLATLLSFFKKEHLYIKYIKAAEATTQERTRYKGNDDHAENTKAAEATTQEGTRDEGNDDHLREWIFPTVKVIFEAPCGSEETGARAEKPEGENDEENIHVRLKEWLEALKSKTTDIEKESEATKAIQDRLDEFIGDGKKMSLEWISPLNGFRQLVKGVTIGGMDEVYRLRFTKEENGDVAVSLRPLVRKLFKEARYDRDLLSGVKQLDYIPFVAADLGDKIITLHHFSETRNILLSFVVSVPATGYEGLWMEHILNNIKRNNGNILGMAAIGRFEEKWLRVSLIVQFQVKNVEDILNPVRALRKFDAAHKIVDGREDSNRGVLLSLIPENKRNKIVHGIPRRKLYLLKAAVHFNSGRQPIEINGKSLQSLMRPNPFDHTVPLDWSRYQGIHGSRYSSRVDNRGSLALKVVEDLRRGSGVHLGIIGAHRVGKTSFAHAIFDILEQKYYSPSAVLDLFTGEDAGGDGQGVGKVWKKLIGRVLIPIKIDPSHTSPSGFAEDVIRSIQDWEKAHKPGTSEKDCQPEMSDKDCLAVSRRYSIHDIRSFTLEDQEYVLLADGLDRLRSFVEEKAEVMKQDRGVVEAYLKGVGDSIKQKQSELLAAARVQKVLGIRGDIQKIFLDLASEVKEKIGDESKRIVYSKRFANFWSVMGPAWRDWLIVDLCQDRQEEEGQNKKIADAAVEKFKAEVMLFLNNELHGEGVLSGQKEDPFGLGKDDPPWGKFANGVKSKLNDSLEAAKRIIDRLPPFADGDGNGEMVKPDIPFSFVIILESLPRDSPWSDPRILEMLHSFIERSPKCLDWVICSSPVVHGRSSEALGAMGHSLIEVNLDRLSVLEAESLLHRLGASPDANIFCGNSGNEDERIPYVTPAAKELILWVTGRYPYLMMVSCYHLYEECTSRHVPIVDCDVVREVVVSRILPGMSDFFERHWSELAEFHELLLKSATGFEQRTWIDRDSGQCSNGLLRNSKMLLALQRACLLREDQAGTVPLFAEWIRKVKG